MKDLPLLHWYSWLKVWWWGRTKSLPDLRQMIDRVDIIIGQNPDYIDFLRKVNIYLRHQYVKRRQEKEWKEYK